MHLQQQRNRDFPVEKDIQASQSGGCLHNIRKVEAYEKPILTVQRQAKICPFQQGIGGTASGGQTCSQASHYLMPRKPRDQIDGSIDLPRPTTSVLWRRSSAMPVKRLSFLIMPMQHDSVEDFTTSFSFLPQKDPGCSCGQWKRSFKRSFWPRPAAPLRSIQYS